MSSSIEKAISRLQKAKENKPEVPNDSTVLSDEEPTVTITAAEPQKAVSGDKPDPSTAVDKKVDVCAPPVPPAQFQSEEPAFKNRIDLDYDALHALGFITPKHKVERLEEEYRVLKRPILMNALGKGAAPVAKGNLVMVTSAMPGEGKSFTALNLAISMAMELDSTVLLVDGDVIRASLSKTLNVDDRVGLTDILEGKIQGLENVIISTDNPKLKIIPAGRRQTYSTELLASDLMGRVAEELSSRYPDRIILFDAPPLLATTEATVLTHIMGQILVVVEAGKCKMPEIKAALSRIEEQKVVGLVLNKSRKNAAGYYGGYYGGYAE